MLAAEEAEVSEVGSTIFTLSSSSPQEISVREHTAITTAEAKEKNFFMLRYF
jgi:hypothetical protein